jgi:putative transposase
MRNDLKRSLVIDELNMAIENCSPAEGLVHHSDRGCQYTTLAFGKRLRESGIVSSVGSVGDCLFTGYSTRESRTRVQSFPG